MKNKRFTAKILIDIGMTICLLLLMPYSLLSETAHEWIGMVMLVSVIRTWAARSVATTIAGYGLYAFYRRQIGDYLIMRMHFVFYDYEKRIFPFLLDYLSVMILIAFIGYYSGVFLKKTGKRKRKGSY
ncbi:MAG: hypothetical protein ACLUD0_18830 [Eubacterium ramulus]